MAINPTYTESPYVGSEGKVLLANRAYVAPPATVRPTGKQAGATPASWSDLGSIDGSVVTIDKADPDIIPVETGLFEVLRAEVAKKDGEATAKWTMVEYEPSVWSSLTSTPTRSVSGGGVAIYVGGKPILQAAILFLGQNPVTFAEFHHYNPKADLTYKPAVVNQFSGIEVTAKFLKFTPDDDDETLARDFEIVWYA